MNRKAVSGMMLTLLLIGMLRLAFARASINAFPIDRQPMHPWTDWKHYHNYTEIVDTLLYLNSTYPSIVDVFSIGKSCQNQDIYCIRLTNENIAHPKPKVFFVGYHHARELISAELPLYFAVEAATNYGTNQTITHMLDYCEIYIVVALNVDAFDAVQANEWQRKNVHPFDEDGDSLLDEDPPDDEDGDGYIEDLFFWNGTYYEIIRWEGIDDDEDGSLNEDWIGGVDTNRNYGYQWNATCDSGSPNPSAEDYRGPAPFSEPETQAIRDIALSQDFKYAISFHSGADVILYPWGYTDTPTPEDSLFREIAANLSSLVGAPYTQSGAGLYTASGLWDDWMYANRSTFALTCEIYTNASAWQYEPGPDPDTWWEKGVLQFFNPHPNQIETVIQRWLPVFTYLTSKAIAEAYDIAITNVTPQETVVEQGFSTSINVTVVNEGDFAETFNVTTYANATVIQIETITLASGDSTIVSPTWNTTGIVKGNYTITANATILLGETDIEDNTFIDGIVEVTGAPPVVINETEYIWYGDFIVNETDTVIIENCSFTVEDGEIWVYGRLSIHNSTITIRSNSLFKNIVVYGNFALYRSTIFGYGTVWAQENSDVWISSSATFWLVADTYSIHIDNSTFNEVTFEALAGPHQCASISNSQIEYLLLQHRPPWTISLSITGSNITNIELVFPRSIELELPQGQIENLSIRDQDQEWNVTISNSFVDMWIVFAPKPDVTLLNSEIEELYLVIHSPSSPVNLTLKEGFIEHTHLHFESIDPTCTVDTTIYNSTIASWSLGCDGGIFSISNSKLQEAVVRGSTSISNSTVSRILAHGGTTVTNCQVNTFSLPYSSGSINLTLNEGYQEYLELSNVTIAQTTVKHWLIYSFGDSKVNIYNSTITGSALYGATGGIRSFGGDVCVYNSNVTEAFCWVGGSLMLVNSTMQTIYGYEDSNVTLIDSSVDTYVTDPTILKRVNSRICTEIYLSIPIQEMSVSVLSNYDIPVPENITRASKYLYVTTTYTDFFEANIRIYFNETELAEQGIDEGELRIYCLKESSVTWEMCSHQGVNTMENYVWANVTHFSVFVIGVSHTPYDMAITEITLSKTVVGQAYSISLDVKIVNQGDFTEALNVTVYADLDMALIGDEITIRKENVTLASGDSTTLTIPWNTTGIAKGNYTIKAHITPLPGETDTTDNTLPDGTVLVTIPGDVNGDRMVDMADIDLINYYFGDPCSACPNCDINCDCTIDMADIDLTNYNFGESW